MNAMNPHFTYVKIEIQRFFGIMELNTIRKSVATFAKEKR